MADMDSVAKRYSIISPGLDFGRVRVVPDNDVGTSDRLHFLPLYSGIAAGLPTSPSGSTNRRMYAGRPIWRRWRLIFKQGN